MGRDLQKWWIRTLIYSILVPFLLVSIMAGIDLAFFGLVSEESYVLGWFFLFLFTIYLKAEDYPVDRYG